MNNKPCLTLDDAKRIAAAAEAEALAHQWAVCIAIVDDDERPRTTYRLFVGR